MDIKEVETMDYDILENVKVSFYRLWKQKIVVLLVTLLGFLATIIYISTVGVSTKYYSSATIYSVVIGSYEDSTYGVTVMNKFADLLGTTRVCDRAAESLKEYGITSSMLASKVNSRGIYLSGVGTESKTFGYSIRLIAVDSSSNYLIQVTNAMANAFADEINDLMGTSSVQVLKEANTVGQYKTINVKKYFLLFTGAAFFFSCVAIFIKEFFSARVYSVAQCEQDKNKVLGMIPYVK
ncbi:MAG: hypothetical protein ACI4F8_11215 [Lachnospiraceae bacterium]